MKHCASFLFALLLLGSASVLVGQVGQVDMTILKDPRDLSRLEVRLRPTENMVNTPYSAGIFTVRFPVSYGVVLSAVPGSSPYGYTFAGPVGEYEGYAYYRFQFAGSVYMVNWEKEQEYPVLKLQISGNMPTNGVFELVTNDTWTRGHNADFYQELNGQELQRKFYVQPIRLREFTAQADPGRNVNLDWSFESEIQLAHSDIEYSVDGREFTLVGQQPAAATKDRHDGRYTFVHAKPQSNVNYYRIRATDLNGAVTYSSVRVINFTDLNADFSVFPNPTGGLLTLACRDLSGYTDGVHYQVVDQAGRIVMSNEVTSDNARIDLSQLAPGGYQLTVWSDITQLANFPVVLAQ